MYGTRVRVTHNNNIAAMTALRWFFPLPSAGWLCPPTLESPPHPRPRYVYVPVRDNGRGVAYDVTVVSPPLGSILASTERTICHAEQRRASLYTRVCAAVEIRLVPLSQETFGGWSGMVFHQISLIVDHQAESTGAPRGLSRKDLFRALSVATQRSIARDIIDRAGRLLEKCPPFAFLSQVVSASACPHVSNTDAFCSAA
jgi:hypothetical protein